MTSATGRVLVTGASGCVGRAAISKLAADGWDVHAVSRTEIPKAQGVTWHEADLLDPTVPRTVVAAIAPTHLLHLAWYIGPGRWASAPENLAWVRASLALVDAAVEAGCRRIVGAGSCLEYDWSFGYCSESRTPLAPHTLYGACKLAVGNLIAAYAPIRNFSSAWGRIFFLYGPHEHPDRLVPSVIRSLLAGDEARVSHGRQIRDYLYVADVGDALVTLLGSDVQGAVNIGTGEPVSLKEIVLTIARLIEREDLVRLGAIPAAPTDTPIVVADTTRLSEDVGWTRRTTLESGLRETIEWWRRSGN
jgi:nucleoside-diphosphate-sugar epimerase